MLRDWSAIILRYQRRTETDSDSLGLPELFSKSVAAAYKIRTRNGGEAWPVRRLSHHLQSQLDRGTQRRDEGDITGMLAREF